MAQWKVVNKKSNVSVYILYIYINSLFFLTFDQNQKKKKNYNVVA